MNSSVLDIKESHTAWLYTHIITSEKHNIHNAVIISAKQKDSHNVVSQQYSTQTISTTERQ